MSITDELRKWAGEKDSQDEDKVQLTAQSQLLQIADRIDKAHDKMRMNMVSTDSIDLMNEFAKGVVAGIEQERENIRDGHSDEFICLPKDKNGEVIHIGDTVKLGDNVETVVGIAENSVFVFYVDENISFDGRSMFIPWSTIGATGIEVIKSDTQEKIDRDVQSLFDCNVDVTPEIIQDLLRRQQELDGVK